MVQYPVSIPRKHYSGNDQRKRAKVREKNEVIERIERHLNGVVKEQKTAVGEHLYAHIARATGYSLETVYECCFAIGGDHNALQVARPGLTTAQARREDLTPPAEGG